MKKIIKKITGMDEFWVEELDMMKRYLSASDFEDAISLNKLAKYVSRANDIRELFQGLVFTVTSMTIAKQIRKYYYTMVDDDDEVDNKVDDASTKKISKETLSAISDFYSKRRNLGRNRYVRGCHNPNFHHKGVVVASSSRLVNDEKVDGGGHHHTAKSRKRKLGSAKIDDQPYVFDHVHIPRRKFATKLKKYGNNYEKGNVVPCSSDSSIVESEAKEEVDVVPITSPVSDSCGVVDRFDVAVPRRRLRVIKKDSIVVNECKEIVPINPDSGYSDHNTAISGVNKKIKKGKKGGSVIKKKGKIDQPDSPMPIIRQLPSIFLERIAELNGREIQLVAQKTLSASDVKDTLSRLMIPVSIVLTTSFLTKVEDDMVDKKEHVEARLLEPLNRFESIKLSKWNMSRNLYYSLLSPWKKVAYENGFVESDVIQLWSFRFDEGEEMNKLGFVVVRVRGGSSSSSASGGGGGGGGGSGSDGDGGCGGGCSSVCSS